MHLGMQKTGLDGPDAASPETEAERKARQESEAAGLFRSVVSEATVGRVSVYT